MDSTLVNILKNSGVAFLPTDTIYGLQAIARDDQAVEKIYSLKGRSEKKPLIVLISSLEDLKKFGVNLSDKEKAFLEKIWPNPVSVILPVKDQKWSFLHRGTSTLAFRMPKNDFLLELLKQTGPLVSTSANPEGMKSAETIKEAKKYFGDKVDFYLDGGKILSQPSTVLALKSGKLEVIRQGSFPLKNLLIWPK